MPSLPTTTTPPIPISDVISRSTQNLKTHIQTRTRPWLPEFLTSLTLPPSLSVATLRFQRNAVYFSVNYSIILTFLFFLPLISSPIPFLLFSLTLFLWLVLHFFREDPVVILGRNVTDFSVFVGLVILSVGVVLITGGVSNGVGIGLCFCVGHCVLRDEDGVFLDEEAAVNDGLIVVSAAGNKKGSMGSGGSSSSRAPVY